MVEPRKHEVRAQQIVQHKGCMSSNIQGHCHFAAAVLHGRLLCHLDADNHHWTDLGVKYNKRDVNVQHAIDLCVKMYVCSQIIKASMSSHAFASIGVQSQSFELAVHWRSSSDMVRFKII